MPILFSAVACDKNVISNFASCGGNFTEIMELVLAKIPEQNQKMTYAHGQYLFHYIVADKYVYFCITDKVSLFATTICSISYQKSIGKFSNLVK